FTEVDWHDGHADDLENPEVITVKFENGLPAEGSSSHIHLNAGTTYRLALTTTDFAGREGAEQEFLAESDIHQIFFLGAPDGVLDYQYADPENKRVGITGYLHVLRPSDSFVFNVILRHLNTGVKANITADDWENTHYRQLSGANDLGLTADVHAVAGGDKGHYTLTSGIEGGAGFRRRLSGIIRHRLLSESPVPYPYVRRHSSTPGS